MNGSPDGAALPVTSETVSIPVKDLHFDRLNPRLDEYDISPTSSDDEVLTVLWDALDVRELVQSIAASGFFPHEPLIVARENDRNVVIEGNRRLAAVRVLLQDRVATEHGWEVPALDAAAREKLKSLPAIVSDRRQSWRFLGFKHVNGPAKWSSYAKAAYIAKVHRDYGIPLADIANQIGDRHRTVQRLYRGLMVIEQAERAKVYDREDRFRQRLAFSHLYTGLDYDGIASFVSLTAEDEETEKPVPVEKLTELGELCVWLYGSRKANRPPVVESQNPDLRRLSAVLADREATAALRAGTELPKAFEISRAASAIFEEALLGAKRALTTARGYSSTGYDGSEALLRIAGSIANMADDLYSEMERRHNPDKRKLRLAEE